ncbi:MAG: helix-turn-helix transcriptional regulator [Pseudonocardiaceae bacterium]
MAEPLDQRVAAIAALDEPTRRQLYEHVVRQPEPVGRDEAATAVGIPRSTAAFHLDRLVDEGLLDAVYQRRSGRSGPGAGRPAKLYTRSQRQVAVSLPERHYELAGHLLAAAIDEAENTGEPPRAALHRRAHQVGEDLGRVARAQPSHADPDQLVRSALEASGFEPRTEGADLVLGNCPFHALAKDHTALVCGMNLSLLTGLLRGLDHRGLDAHLDPAPGRCCVRLGPPVADGCRR